MIVSAILVHLINTLSFLPVGTNSASFSAWKQAPGLLEGAAVFFRVQYNVLHKCSQVNLNRKAAAGGAGAGWVRRLIARFSVDGGGRGRKREREMPEWGGWMKKKKKRRREEKLDWNWRFSFCRLHSRGRAFNPCTTFLCSAVGEQKCVFTSLSFRQAAASHWTWMFNGGAVTTMFACMYFFSFLFFWTNTLLCRKIFLSGDVSSSNLSFSVQST